MINFPSTFAQIVKEFVGTEQRFLCPPPVWQEGRKKKNTPDTCRVMIPDRVRLSVQVRANSHVLHILRQFIPPRLQTRADIKNGSDSRHRVAAM